MKDKIKNYIVNELLNDKGDINIATDDDILSDGLIDSIDVVQLITFIEENFEVVIPPEDMVIENFITIDAIEGYIEKSKN